MKKILFTLLAVLIFSGCGGMTDKEMGEKIQSCKDNGLSWEEANNKIDCDDPDTSCRYTCRYLFDGVADTWGADGAGEDISGDILTCFQECIERYSS